MTRILVVDDHELMRRGVRSILTGAFPDLGTGRGGRRPASAGRRREKSL